MGTPYYMAPEQKLDAGNVDQRADIYSVGVVLFELLTLENTFGLEMPTEINEDLPVEIDEVIKRALVTRPEKRYDEAGEVGAALLQVVQAEKRRQDRVRIEEAARVERETELARRQKEKEGAEKRQREEERKGQARKQREATEAEKRFRHVEEAKRTRAEEDAFWEECRGEDTLEAYRRYVKRYPLGAYVVDAQVTIRRKELESAPVEGAGIDKAEEENVLGKKPGLVRIIIRFFIILVSSASGLFIAHGYYGFPIAIIGFFVGFIVALFVIKIEKSIGFDLGSKKMHLRHGVEEKIGRAEKEPKRTSYMKKLWFLGVSVMTIFVIYIIIMVEIADIRKLEQSAKEEKTGQKVEARARQQAEAKAKQEAEKGFTNSLGMRFVLIPAGTFTMGSPSNEPDRNDNETLHQVTISRPFYMQTTEVTHGQWKKVMGKKPSGYKDCGDDCPVMYVSWDDVQEFIRKLNSMEGTDRYRLPTEAEWEYAARSGGRSERWAGTNNEANLDEYAWYYSNSGREMNPVGTKKSNGLGLYDMSGNVYELVEDWFGNYSAGPLTDPKGPSKGSARVVRGGSWLSSARELRSANRESIGGTPPNDRNVLFGFRLAKTQ
jgi:formylglycine-generating enzyme required for sulfatase activity